MRLFTYIGVFSFLVFVSCSKEDDAIAPGLDTGRTDFSLTVDDQERQAVIHVPDSYDHSKEHAVVFMLHGTSGTGNKFYNISGWVEKAEQESFIAVFPTALRYELIDGTRTTKWSSDGLAKDLPQGTQIYDDKVFLSTLIEALTNSLNIDDSRIYICGFSNGSGFVKSEVLPKMSGTFAAANVSGGVGIPQYYEVQGERTMPVFNISGTKDPKIFEKIGSNEELPITGADLEAHDFLWDQLSTLCDMMGLETEYAEQRNQGVWNQLVFTNQLSNNAADEYRFMMVKDMAHVFPNESNNPNGVKAVDVLWPWFEQWTL